MTKVRWELQAGGKGFKQFFFSIDISVYSKDDIVLVLVDLGLF
jgi:hypothetical protein